MAESLAPSTWGRQRRQMRRKFRMRRKRRGRRWDTWKFLSLSPGFLQRRVAARSPGTSARPESREFTSSMASSLAFQLASPSSFTRASVNTSPALASAPSRAISGSLETPPCTVLALGAALALAEEGLEPPAFTALVPRADLGLAIAGLSVGFTTLGPGLASGLASTAFLGLGAADLPTSWQDSAFSLIFSIFNLSRSGMKGVTLFSPRNLTSAPSASAEASRTSPSDSLRVSRSADTYPFIIFLLVASTGGHWQKHLARKAAVSFLPWGVLDFRLASTSSWTASMPRMG